METPSITIDGKTIEPTPPTMAVWRGTVDFMDAEKAGWTLEDFGKRYVAYIVTAFNRPEVTAEAVEESLLAADLVPLGNALMNWVYMQILAPLAQVPNADAPEAES